MKTMQSGKRNSPLKVIIPIKEIINTINIIELDLLYLNESNGNFAKWTGLIIKYPNSAANIRAVLGSPISP